MFLYTMNRSKKRLPRKTQSWLDLNYPRNKVLQLHVMSQRISKQVLSVLLIQYNEHILHQAHAPMPLMACHLYGETLHIEV